jgi:hypothetical protein
MRQLVGRAPLADLFGVKGRKWLAEVGLPPEERETVDSAMRPPIVQIGLPSMRSP